MDSPDEIEVVARRLRDGGQRWTPQRRLITAVVFDTHEHFSADELLAMCRRRDRRVSRATVYRMLAVLEAEGFLASLDTGDGGLRYEHVLGHDHHDHMICRTCARIVEFADPDLEQRKAELARRHGFRLVGHELKLFVECLDETCPGRQDRRRTP
jgi:Fur family ferric uptake transcriptional regulator